MRIFLMIICLGAWNAFAQPTLDKLAEDYVKLGLLIGEYDDDFVDAYYGPDSLKPVKPAPGAFPKDSLLSAIGGLQTKLKAFVTSKDEVLRSRAIWMQQQLIAFSRRVKIFSGEESNFDTESRELFGVVAPSHKESYFIELLKELDQLLPGEGAVHERFQNIATRFVLPAEKIDTVFRLAITEARKRTLKHYNLPGKEDFKLEYVTGKSWSGYNWYQGNYHSLIQINIDLPVYAERATDLACHEGYPGHHVYNAKLEENLYRKNGWVEISLYPLFSPQSFIAEGSANYGIKLAFPGRQQMYYVRDHLLPAAGIDTTGFDMYFRALELKGKLNFARNEVARGVVNKTMSDSTAIDWLQKYNLFSRPAAEKSLRFIKKYRSYVINYNYGQEVVQKYVEKRAGTNGLPEKQWGAFEFLLSNPVTTAELLQ